MTNEEKMKWQTQQDAITLDYPAWSQQRTRAGLSNNHDLWEEQRDDVLARQQSANAESRRKRLAGLEAAKAEKQSERDAEIDLELADEKDGFKMNGSLIIRHKRRRTLRKRRGIYSEKI